MLVLAPAMLAGAAPAQNDGEQQPYAPLEQALRQTTLAGLVGLLNNETLSREAGFTGVELPPALLQRFAAQPVQGHRLYEHPQSGLLLRLGLAPRGVNWLRLRYHSEHSEHSEHAQPLSGWYDQALGAPLSSLAGAMVALANDGAGRRFLASLGNPIEQRALRAFAQLPATLQTADSARLLVSACAGESCHAQALLALDRRAEQGGDGLWQLDLAVLGRDWRRFDRLMTQLQVRLGPDPTLAWLASSAWVHRQNCAAALEQAVPAQRRWPEYLPLYSLLAQCQVEQGDYPQALETLLQMQSRFGLQLDWDALVRDPAYAPLAGSEAFRAWRQASPE